MNAAYVLKKVKINVAMIARVARIQCRTECGNCGNGQMQMKRIPKCFVSQVGDKGEGLFADEDIPENKLIVEYIGREYDQAEL